MPADALHRLEAEIRSLASRVAAQDARLAAIESKLGDLGSVGMESLELLDDLREGLETSRLMAAGAISADEAARRADYQRIVAGVRRVVRQFTPETSRILVIGRGDEQIVRLGGRRAAHFPQDAAGDFAGEYPADGADAVRQLDRLVADGGWDHLLIPATATWWLDHYPALRRHLHREWHALHDDPAVGALFARDPARPGPWHGCDTMLDGVRRAMGRPPAILDWDTDTELSAYVPTCIVFAPLTAGVDRLPYMDASVDVVAIRSDATGKLDEARRIATDAVLIISPPRVAGPGFVVAVEPPHVARQRPQRSQGLVVPQVP